MLTKSDVCECVPLLCSSSLTTRTGNPFVTKLIKAGVPLLPIRCNAAKTRTTSHHLWRSGNFSWGISRDNWRDSNHAIRAHSLEKKTNLCLKTVCDDVVNVFSTSTNIRNFLLLIASQLAKGWDIWVNCSQAISSSCSATNIISPEKRKLAQGWKIILLCVPLKPTNHLPYTTSFQNTNNGFTDLQVLLYRCDGTGKLITSSVYLYSLWTAFCKGHSRTS